MLCGLLLSQDRQRLCLSFRIRRGFNGCRRRLRRGSRCFLCDRGRCGLLSRHGSSGGLLCGPRLWRWLGRRGCGECLRLPVTGGGLDLFRLGGGSDLGAKCFTRFGLLFRRQPASRSGRRLERRLLLLSPSLLQDSLGYGLDLLIGCRCRSGLLRAHFSQLLFEQSLRLSLCVCARRGAGRGVLFVDILLERPRK